MPNESQGLAANNLLHTAPMTLAGLSFMLLVTMVPAAGLLGVPAGRRIPSGPRRPWRPRA